MLTYKHLEGSLTWFGPRQWRPILHRAIDIFQNALKPPSARLCNNRHREGQHRSHHFQWLVLGKTASMVERMLEKRDRQQTAGFQRLLGFKIALFGEGKDFSVALCSSRERCQEWEHALVPCLNARELDQSACCCHCAINLRIPQMLAVWALGQLIVSASFNDPPRQRLAHWKCTSSLCTRSQPLLYLPTTTAYHPPSWPDNHL